jgi:crotonobetainyl-CoA:carnitine CoA-transferase CaiB-like acyl-CoA transferase
MKPLEGIKVLELATFIAAPIASRMMCDFGAEVTKIESLGGDPMREVGIQENVACDDDKNPLFTLTNSNKQLISVDIKTQSGKEVISKLLAQTDVFITNVRMKSLEKMGLDYESIKMKFPQLIYAHFSGYGLKGPAANYPGFDSTAFWLRSGPMSDWQEKDAFPMHPTYAFGDIATSSVFLNGILLALHGRERTNQGTLVNASLYASGIWDNAIAVIETQEQFGKNRDQRPDPLEPVDPFSAYYKCKDGKWIGVFCNTYQGDMEKFAKLFNITDIMNDPRCIDTPTLHKTKAIREVVSRINKIMLSKTSDEWNRIFIDNNISNEIAYGASDVHKDIQARENNYLEEVEFADELMVWMPTSPIQLSNFEKRACKSSGRIGEDTDAVMKELKYTEEEIKQLKEDKVIKS